MASDPEKFRLLLADAHSLFRESVKLVLAGEADLEVVAEAQEGTEAVSEAFRTRPHVAVIDCNLPNCDGIRATRLIKQSTPECQVLVISGEEDQSVLIEALEAGASGYLSKESPISELLDAARALAHGEFLVPKRMLGSLLNDLISRKTKHDEALHRMNYLTKREREVLAFLSEGKDKEEIAQALVISPQTARTHIQNILTKLGVHSRLEAAAFVLQTGILEDLANA